MTNLPEKIDCIVTEDGNPVLGLMLWAEFKTARKNLYMFVFGPTGREGHAYLDHAMIFQKAESQLNLALMDYDPLEKAFVGVVRIGIMQESAYSKCVSCLRSF